MLNNKQNNALKHIAKTFKLAQSEILDLYFIDLTKTKSDNSKINNFIQANLKQNSTIALVSDEINVMSDDETALYPIDPANLAVLTDTDVFGIDNTISQNIQELIKLLDTNNIKNLNIDTIFIASGQLDI